MLKILTFLGTGSYKSNTIRINGFTRIHKIFPIALAEYKLLNVPKESLELVFFLTPESKAHENWNEHTKPHLDCMKIKYRIVDITADINPIELVRKMMEVVNEGDEVILDTTHSFRSIPITAAIISLYLREAKNVNVRIFYGLYDGVSKSTEALDLTNVIDMADWLYAARLFKEYGYSKPLGELVRKRNSSFYEDKKENTRERPKKLGNLEGALRNLSTALRLGSIRSIREYVRKLMSLFEDSQRELMGELERFAPELYPLVPSMLERYRKIDTGRKTVELDEKELDAERKLLKFYLDTEDLGMALRLAREYLVNVALYKQGLKEKVLDRKTRESVEFPEENFIRDARNHVAHFGFNKDNLPSQKKVEERLREIAEKTPDELFKEYEQAEAESVKAVLSPLGTSKGALFTILKHFKPDVLVIVTSKQAAENVPEILEKAGFSGKHHVVLVNDPFTGVDEVEKVVEEARKYLEENGVREV
ncbi:MAG: hypothetical protein PWP09_1597, partial [Thermotogota bacterium]|nr:hypothetical protein [Thermotogota bacterium]